MSSLLTPSMTCKAEQVTDSPAILIRPTDLVSERWSLGWSRVPGTWLYRVWGTGSTLLYIGVSGNLPSRLWSHKRKKPWWPDVDHIDLTFYAAEHVALAAERTSIKELRPIHNIRSKPAGT